VAPLGIARLQRDFWRPPTRAMTIPQTDPAPPIVKPHREPAPTRETPQPESPREPDPFDPAWPPDRPTPRPKALA
jgi:hypothetical protein